MLRKALRKHVRRPDGGIQKTFGGGVPIIRICFNTEIVFWRVSTRSAFVFLFSLSVPSKNAINSI